jgi:Cu(I)/Ag(I) efflux system membrane protein CusA/SilA
MLLGYNFSVADWVGYIALFGIAVETGVVMVVYLHEALDKRRVSAVPLTREGIHEATIEGSVQRLRPKLMTVVHCTSQPRADPLGNGLGSDADLFRAFERPCTRLI